MCDTQELESWAASALTRRQVGMAGAATAAAAACAPMAAGPSRGVAGAPAERMVEIATADGTLDGEFYTPPGRRKHPGVVLWPDIAGIRPAKRQMARRLAQAGYAVLLANPYYRDVKGQQFEDFAAFMSAGGFQNVTPWRNRFNLSTVKADTAAVAAWLGKQAEVDTARGMGAQGYCMTGSFGLVAPSAAAGMKAGASFHGGGLVNADAARSPAATMQPGRHYLVAIGKNDDAKAPGEKDALRAAATAARAEAEIEVYPADHGWCVPDSPSYNQAEADRAWSRLLALYAKL